QELLRYTVAHALEGRTDELKESVLGVEVFGRTPGYDSASSSIVRVEFSRLRKKLPHRRETCKIRASYVTPNGHSALLSDYISGPAKAAATSWHCDSRNHTRGTRIRPTGAESCARSAARECAVCGCRDFS